MAEQDFTTEYILGLIGGIIMIAIGIPCIIFFGLGLWFIGWGIGMVITSVNLKNKRNPRTNAIWLLICSIVAGGNLLGIIAGILALTKTK